MKKAYHIGGGWAPGLWLVAAAISGLACTGTGISKAKMSQLQRQVRTTGLILGFEGLQPFSGHRADNLTKQVARELNLAQAATTGHSSVYMPLVATAHANGQPIYVVGYSLGGNEARRLAERCKKEGIPVDILFLLDPGAMGVFTGKIPANVRRVVFYQSGTYESSLCGEPNSEFLENPDRTQVEFQDLSDLNHMNLPTHLARKIRDQIEGGPAGGSGG
jgi:hypothetical protein